MDFLNLEIIAKGFLISWFFVQFSPIQNLLSFLPQKIGFIKTALSCLKCMTFWLTLIISTNPLTAITASFIAFILDKHIINAPIKL